MNPLRVWLLNPYHAGSHQAWAGGYARHSRHSVRILAMEGRFWKWRMQGGALELAGQARSLLEGGEQPDVLLATGMTNLPAFLALTRVTIPAVLYMHENQLTYPPPPGSKRDLTYGMIQHLSMLVAERIVFNSAFHLGSWFAELPRLLKHFPDYPHLETVAEAQTKSSVLPVGCELRQYDRFIQGARREGAPLILWNQRWEYDKDPGCMLRALYRLADSGFDFRVALAGENFRIMPEEFAGAREQLGERLVHYGYADPETYGRLLASAHLTLSTAIHEFFGVSVVEATYCGCWPLLPARLSYPELLPSAFHDTCLYRSEEELDARLRLLLAGPPAPPDLSEAAARFDWSYLAPKYDALLDEVAGRRADRRSGVWNETERVAPE